MFENAGKKRQVSMSGRGAGSKQTALSLTESVRLEREKRARDRLCEKSALLLQKRVRGLLARQNARRAFKQEFLSKFTSIKRLEDSLVAGGKLAPSQRYLTEAVCMPLIRISLFVNEPNDRGMVQGLLLLLRRGKMVASLLYSHALLRFLFRALATGSSEADVSVVKDLLASARAQEYSPLQVVREACWCACQSSNLEWEALAVEILRDASGSMTDDELQARALGEAILIASQVDCNRAAALLLRAQVPIAQLTVSFLRAQSNGAARTFLFGNAMPRPRAMNHARVLCALSLLAQLPSTDLEAKGLVECCMLYYSANAMEVDDEMAERSLVRFRALMRFPASWPFLNLLHDASRGRSSDFLCSDAAVLREMWCGDETVQQHMDYACKSMLHYIELVDDFELFRVDFLPTVISKLKQSLFEQSLQRNQAFARTNVSDLFTALYERFSRREEEEEDARITSTSVGSSSSANKDVGKLWLFPPQANLTSPRSREICKLVPMVFPFEQRVKSFQEALRRVQQEDFNFALMMDPANFVQVRLNRDNLVEDAFAQLREFDFSTAKQRLKITFVNSLGLEEAGIGQGIFKEFLTQFCAQAFATPRLFSQTSRGTFFPSSLDLARDLPWYEFFGRVIGKAVCDGVLIESQLSPFVINLLLQRSNSVHDLQFLDSDFYFQLLSLKRQPGEALLDLGLSFSTWSGGREVDLIPRGNTIPVTARNLDAYIAALCNFKLNIEYADQIHAIANGFAKALSGLDAGMEDVGMLDLCQMFSSKEFAMVIGGNKRFLVADLRANVQYAGGYHASQDYIRDFWAVVSEDLTPAQQSKLLRFITSCSRPPLAGFAELDPKVTIYQVRGEEDRLPTSSTCVNLLKLPKYATKEILRQKLLMAIESDSGFELS